MTDCGGIDHTGAWDFTTKDSGERQEYASGMKRDTEAGKARFDLLTPKGVPYEAQMQTRFAALMARGAEKYGDRNWEKADSEKELERYLSSGLRHMQQWAAGETDEDHAAAVMFNLMAAETLKWKLKRDEDIAQEVKLRAMQDAINATSRRMREISVALAGPFDYRFDSDTRAWRMM